jgi:hypothetical protein
MSQHNGQTTRITFQIEVTERMRMPEPLGYFLKTDFRQDFLFSNSSANANQISLGQRVEEMKRLLGHIEANVLTHACAMELIGLHQQAV